MIKNLLAALAAFGFLQANAQNRFITISKENPSYFAFSDGSTYIPVGINMIHPTEGNENNIDSAFAEIESWMKKLSENGGNYIRAFISYDLLDMEQKAGVYDSSIVQRIDRYFSLARKYHLRIKVTLEYFRGITMEEKTRDWETKFAYHKSKGGPLDSIGQYFYTPQGQKLLLDKLDFYQKRYGSDTLFFAWELWNEMNTVKVPIDEKFWTWNESMLKVLKQKFPENLVVQSLGSFDVDYAKPIYERMIKMPGNEVAQVHRYLDLGAQWDICHAPMDVIAASAVKDLKAFGVSKPILLSESGAVDPKHIGPSKYYPGDTAGIILHDVLFAPFFSGAAGTGMSWHWESYVAVNDLWYHFGRFNEAIKGVDPIKENFVPGFSENDNMRIYSLKGKNISLVWVRDKKSDWKTELDEGIAATTLRKATIQLPGAFNIKTVDVYDPWKNIHTQVKVRNNSIQLPDFKRSLMIRMVH